MQPIKNFRNPERAKTYLAPEVTPENLESYREALQPKSQRKDELPITGYAAIKRIEASRGLITGRTAPPLSGPQIPRVPNSKRGRRPPTGSSGVLGSYWSTYPYHCQACGESGQRPNNHNEGPVTVRRLDQLHGSGDELDDDLVALCTPCLNETLEVAEQTEEEWEKVVSRFTSRHRRGEARRRRTISNQAHERRHRRARKQEHKEKLAGHIERYKTEGIPIPREFVYEYADVHRR